MASHTPAAGPLSLENAKWNLWILSVELELREKYRYQYRRSVARFHAIPPGCAYPSSSLSASIVRAVMASLSFRRQ